MSTKSHIRTHKRGFTLIELVVGIVVIGILATIGTVSYAGYKKRAQQALVTTAAEEAADAIRAALGAGEAMPATLAAAGAKQDSKISYQYTTAGDIFCVKASHVSDSTIKAAYGTYDNCGGLTASYYNDQSLSGTPVLSRIEDGPPIYNTAGSLVPGKVNPDYMSASWHGYLTVPVSGTYTIYISGDDFTYFYIDNVEQIAGGVGRGGEVSKTFTFIAGQHLSIKYTMVENGGAAGISTSWSYPGQAKQIIPSLFFSTT